MKRLLILLLILFNLVFVNALIVKDVSFESTSNSNISVNTSKAIITNNITLGSDYVLLTNVSFNNTENFYKNSTYTTEIGDFNWTSNFNIDTGNFLDYFRFNVSGTLLENFTFNSLDSIGDTIAVYFEDIAPEGSKSWLFEKFGYVSQTFGFTFDYESSNNITYNVNQSSITFTIYDQVTGNEITGLNFTIELVATVGATLYTNNASSVTVENLLFADEEYYATITHPDYETEQIFFDFNNQEELNIDVYMIESNESSLGFVNIQVLNRLSKPLSGIDIQALQWDSSTSSFIVVSQGKTEEDGTGTLNVILDSKYYKFKAIGTDTSVESLEQIISSTENGKTITLTLPDTASERSYLFQNLDVTIDESFNNITNVSTFSVSWTDYTSIERTVCLNVYRIISLTETLIETHCGASGTSGSYIKAFSINTSQDIKIKGQVLVDGTYYTVEEFFYPSVSHPANVFKDLGLHILIIPLLFILSIALGIYIKNIYIGAMLLIISAGISLSLAPTLITGGITAFIMFIGIMIIWGGTRR